MAQVETDGEIAKLTGRLHQAGIKPRVEHRIEQPRGGGYKYVTNIKVIDGFTRSTLEAEGYSYISADDAHLTALHNFFIGIAEVKE